MRCASTSISSCLEWAALTAAVVLVSGPASVARAQQPGLAADLVLGAAMASGNTARASGNGGAIGAGISHRISDRIALTTDLYLSKFYDGVSPAEGFGTSTDISVWRITVGPTLRLTNTTSTWGLSARAGIGIAGVRSGPLPQGPSQEPQEPRNAGLNEDVFALTGGFELSRDVGWAFVPFIRAQFDLYDMKHFLLGLSSLDPDIPINGPLHAFSLQAGIRLEF